MITDPKLKAVERSDFNHSDTPAQLVTVTLALPVALTATVPQPVAPIQAQPQPGSPITAA